MTPPSVPRPISRPRRPVQPAPVEAPKAPEEIEPWQLKTIEATPLSLLSLFQDAPHVSPSPPAGAERSEDVPRAASVSRIGAVPDQPVVAASLIDNEQEPAIPDPAQVPARRLFAVDAWSALRAQYPPASGKLRRKVPAPQQRQASLWDPEELAASPAQTATQPSLWS